VVEATLASLPSAKADRIMASASIISNAKTMRPRRGRAPGPPEVPVEDA
jgi:hypothetical protein